jgi:hypothetical protein
MLDMFTSEDQQEGIAAFFGKRPALFGRGKYKQ